jgi:hypothetical protein
MCSRSIRAPGFLGKKRVQFALLALMAFGDPARASAQPIHQARVVEPRSAALESEPQTRSYGWQTGLADGLAVGLFAGGLATYDLCVFSPCSNNATSEALLAFSLFTYAAGAPLIHGAHGRWGTAGASFGLRAAPIVVGLSLMEVDEGSGGAVILGGAVLAMIVDSTVLAREPVPRASSKFHLTPVVDPRRRTGFVLVTRDF